MAKQQNEPQESAVDPRAPIESTWRGLTVWQCPFCARDGEDKAEIAAHIAHAHPERSLSVTEALALERTEAGLPPVVEPPDAPTGESATNAPEQPAEKGE